MNLYHLKCFPFFGLLPKEENDRPNAPVTNHCNSNPDHAHFKTIPKSHDKSRRTAIVDITETYMVNFTSPAARSPLLSAPEKGYAAALNTLWIKTSQITSRLVSGCKA